MTPFRLLEYGLASAGSVLAVGMALVFVIVIFLYLVAARPPKP